MSTVQHQLTQYQIQRNKADLEHDEIVENCRILLVAGSETTATHLSGVVYFLAKTPTQLRAAQAEVRSAFKSHEQITVHAVSSSEKLPYVNAVIQETFRCYPTVPSVLPRVTNSSGSIIVGEFVAGNVRYPLYLLILLRPVQISLTEPIDIGRCPSLVCILPPRQFSRTRKVRPRALVA